MCLRQLLEEEWVAFSAMVDRFHFGRGRRLQCRKPLKQIEGVCRR